MTKRLLIFNKYNGTCAYCGLKISIDNFNIDHIIPVNRIKSSQQTPNSKLENLNPSCINCNCSKNNLTLEEWRVSIERRFDYLLNNNGSFVLLLNHGIIKKEKNNVMFHFENNFNV